MSALEAGAHFVLGVDRHATYLEQAELVFEAKGIDPDRYRFERGDIFGHAFGGGFEVVLCLGVMEVTSEPLRLFELFDSVSAEIVVIDTVVSHSPAATFELSAWTTPRTGPSSCGCSCRAHGRFSSWGGSSVIAPSPWSTT